MLAQAPTVRIPNRVMIDAKFRAVSWDIEEYAIVPKGALREEVREKTSNAVVQKLCW